MELNKEFVKKYYIYIYIYIYIFIYIDQHTNSLFYKVFKAKYFSKEFVFDTKVSSGLFAWRSILYARQIISQGAKWRIGDGSQIMIYESNWPPGESQG